MSTVFADTSGLLALLSSNDEYHARAVQAFNTLRTERTPLRSTSYVLVETYALVGHRLGLDAVRQFRDDFVPILDITWVDETLHNAGLDLQLGRENRRLSLVDAVSFIAMRRQGLTRVFGFDSHFEREGFSFVD